MSLRTIQFDPMFVGEVDDFTVQWRAGGRPVLASGETISTATSAITAGDVTVSGTTTISGTDTTTRISASGATAGTTARARVTITTSLGRTLIQPIAFLVEAVS